MISKWLKYCLPAIAVLIVGAAAVREAPRITKEEAKALLGSPKVVFVDARVSAAWNTSDQKIKGAVRADQGDFETWAAGYGKETTFIVY